MRLKLLLLSFVAAAPSCVFASDAELALGPIWSDNIVVQRDAPIVIEGEASASAQITARLGSVSASSAADASGRWRIELPAMQAGGPYTLTVADNRQHHVAVNEIMLGDVWLCSGQSNMELPVSRALDFEGEMGRAADPMMRLLTVPKAALATPASRFSEPANWMKADRGSVADFSAACYFMAKDLRKRTGVAVGLVDASWGGTQIKAWLSPDATRAIYGAAEADLLKTFNTDPLKAVTLFAPKWEDWLRKTTGLAKGKEPWIDSKAVPWKPMPAIGPWEAWPDGGMADFNGWVWAKRELRLTAAQAKQEATLNLGVIDDMDQSWVNGNVIGNSFGWSFERKYRVPAEYFKAGGNTITIAIGDSWGAGGFQGPASKLKLEFADGSTVPLSDAWDYSKTSIKSNPPRTPWDTNAGLGLIHNGMIAPLGGFRMKGAAWYQGESDVGLAAYDKRLAALIDGWRKQFGNADLPVAIVSLANFGPPAGTPNDSGWARLREEQRLAVQTIPATALVQAIDIGDRTDIHPANKNELGRRLGRAAAILTGIETSAKNGPQILSAKREGDSIIVRFTGVNGELKSWSANHAIGFELCGGTALTCRFVSAIAEGDSVRLATGGLVAREVRYAWADSPVVNVFDSDSLPIEPFRIEVAE